MPMRKIFLQWPVLRQLRSTDKLGRGPAVTSEHTRALTPRTTTADRVVQSVCPYCAVGCGQLVHVKGGEITDIEGDPETATPQVLERKPDLPGRARSPGSVQ